MSRLLAAALFLAVGFVLGAFAQAQYDPYGG